MAKNKKRLSIPGLNPDTEYVIQVRAKDSGEASTWSRKYNVLTIDDTISGTRAPVDCVLTSFEISAEGLYTAVWPTVATNTDGTESVIRYYEIELSTPSVTKIVPHYGTTGANQTASWSKAAIAAILGGGTVPPEVTAKVRAVNSVGNHSKEWSNAITAYMPVPYPPTNPNGLPVVDGIKVTWEPPAEAFVAGDPRWPAGYRVYVGLSEDFVPDPVTKAGMIYEGGALEAMYVTMSYEMSHWFKICSYSTANMQSEYVTTGPFKPISPYGPDLVGPSVPVLAQPTFNTDRTVSGQANLTWTHDAELEDNKDTSGFVVAWRLVGDERWRNSYFEKDARSGVIDLPRAFANYEFKIAAYDFVANYSAFSAVRTLEGAGPAPGPLTGVDAVTRWDGMKLLWNHSESQAVVNGGKYEIQFKPTNSFTDDVATYVTGNRELDLAGLTPAQSTWYWRVRAVDVMGRTGPWSAVQTDVLPAFPSTATKDGIKPQDAPSNVKVAGGLNYINASWDRVVNTDAVWYEVYMSTTSGFTIGTANFAGETSATSIMLNSLPGGPSGGALQQNTTYYVKVRAVDADGAGPVSSQASSQLIQIAAGDLGINMSGENLLYNTSFETDSNSDGLADYWLAYNNSVAGQPHTATLPATGRTGGLAQRVQWTGVNSSTKGIYCNGTQQVTRPFTEYTLSFYAKAGTLATPPVGAGSGFGLAFNKPPVTQTWLSNPPPSATNFQRYIVKFTTGEEVDTNNFFITIRDHTANGGFVEFDDIQLEAGNIASAYKVGTVSIAKLASGRMSTAEMIIDSDGIIRSDDYNSANKLGFSISRHGIDLFEGTVNAGTLAAGTTISENLYVGALLEVAGDGIIQSALYRTSGGTQGYRITKDVIDIRSGMVAAGALSAGQITSPLITIGNGGKITVASNGSIQSNNYAQGTTGWKISSAGIEMWDANSKINVSALETGTLSSTVVTIGSGGELVSENWDDTNKTGYRLAEDGFVMYNGVLEGSTIRTNQIYSLKEDPQSKMPTFSINNDGFAEFAGAWIHGNTRVADATWNVIQSGNYSDSGTGWRIRGDGFAQFFDVTTWGLNVNGSARVGNGSQHSISSFNWSPNAAGWVIRGDGYAEFNAGWLSVGNPTGGKVVMSQTDNGAGSVWGMVRFYQPGSTTNFHNIRSDGNVLSMRGAWGGAVEIHPEGRVSLASNVTITQTLTTGGSINVGGAGTIGGQLVVNGAMAVEQEMYANKGLRVVALQGTGGQRYVVAGDSGWVSRGGSTSSRDIKRDIAPLDLDTKKILALEPKSFGYKSDPEGTPRSVGFIVEDADELGLSDFVDYHANGKPQAFDYPYFVTALQQTNRAQQAEIDELRGMVEELRRRS